ncbi:MAG: hypothetical protein ACRDNE_05910 [Gaiellaceae bacterium]
MRLARRFAFPLALAGKRLLRRRGRVVLTGLGIATGSLALAVVLAGSLVVQDRSLSRAAERLPEAEQAVRAFWLGVPRTETWESLDRAADEALRPLAGRDPTSVLVYRQTQVGGALVDLGAADDLGRWVRLRSGRLPRQCRPERCEVVQLAGSGRIPDVPGLRLVRVGEATLASAVPFGPFVAREEPSLRGRALQYHTASSPPFLLAEGVEQLSRASPLDGVYRSYGWVVPVEPASVHPWTVDRFAARVTRARSELEAHAPAFDVVAPVSQLEEAAESGAVAGTRLLLVGGQAAALLLAFTVLAAVGARRDLGAARRRLTWFGARRWQVVLFSATEPTAVAVVGTLGGWLAGAGIAAALARATSSPAGSILGHTVFSGRGAVLAASLAGGAALLLLLCSTSARPLRLGGLSLSPLDVAALGALGAVALGLARGEADARALAAEGGGLFVLLLPGLVALVAAVVAARVLAPTLRLLERLGRRRPVSLRLAALSLARNPGHAAVAVTFLVASLGLALFAEAYRATLFAGQEAQARYAVPADFVLTEDPARLVSVTEAAPVSLARSLAPGADVLEVVRRSGSVARLSSRGVTLLGLPAERLAGIDGWRGDFARSSLAQLAARISSGPGASLQTVPLPPGARELRLPVSVEGDAVLLTATLRTSRGRIVSVTLGATRGERRVVLRSRIPAEARGGSLVQLVFRPARDTRRDPGGGVGVQEPAAAANLTLGPLRAAGPGGATVVPLDYRRWAGFDGAREVDAGSRGVRLALILTTEFDARFRPRQPTDGEPIPVVASPRLAAAAGANGILPVQLAGEQVIGRVVAAAERFPSVDGDFLLADRDLLAVALDAQRPGAGTTTELWLDAPEGGRGELAARLARAPFEVLEVRSQARLLEDLRADPLARGTLLALVGAAAAALSLALVGLLLGLVADLRDESGELFELEAQGADPATLRRHLRLRAAGTILFGLAGGLGAGAVLSGLVVGLVTLTAGAAAAEPPLRLSLDWPVLGLALGGYLTVSAVLVLLVTWGGFRTREAGRLAKVGG